MLFLPICEYVYFECNYWPVYSYVTVEPTGWFVAIGQTNRFFAGGPTGLLPVDRRWTAGQDYVGPTADVAGGPTG